MTFGSIAWSRDNGNDPGDCCGGQLTDRWGGQYTLQITSVAGAGWDTPDTGDPATGWQTIAVVDYKQAAPPEFRPWLRHRFDFSRDGQPLTATGLRVKVSDVGTCMDELEVYAPAAAPPVLEIRDGATGLLLIWTGGGTLRSAPTASGPWTTESGATSPHPVVPDGPERYFQVLE